MKRTGSIIYAILFMAVCSVSAVAMLFGYKPKNMENRPLSRMPKFSIASISDFPGNFESYFDDNFGLREEMVTAFNALTLGIFNDTLNQKVIAGDDMLFFRQTLPDYQRTNALTDDELERIAQYLKSQSDYAKSIGASFTFMVAPNKNTVYPELMPSYYKRSGLKSNRERLYERLFELDVDTIDLAELLISNKSSGLLYHSRDTHYNDRGALITYRAIMQKIAPNALWEDYSAIQPTEYRDYAGDLNNFVLPSISPNNPRPVYDIEAFFQYDEGTRPNQDAVFGTKGKENGIRLYMMRDSFAIALIPYISANTQRAVYSSIFPYDFSNVSEEAPTAIIVEIAERNIGLVAG